jgi:hypothetical protein
LCRPLKDIGAINDRLNAVEDLIKHASIAGTFFSLSFSTSHTSHTHTQNLFVST